MILVTGGTGFLGSHVLYELIKKNLPVRATYRNPGHREVTRKIFSCYDSGEDYFNRIEWTECDITDYYSAFQTVSGSSLVFHTAGCVSFNDRDEVKLNRINAEGTANIVNACLEQEVKGLCHVSSIAALGDLVPGNPVSENIIWNQGKKASAYSKSKFRAEMEVWRGISEGLNAVIVNPSVIIGPGMWHGPGHTLWESVQKGMKYYTDGSTGYVDAGDVARIMIWLVENGIYGERYILNSDHMSNREFLSKLASGFGNAPPRIKVSPLLSELALAGESVRALITGTEKRFTRRIIKTAGENLSYANEKITTLTGYRFLPVEESINRSVEAFRRESRNL